jgi:hypothetical protein
MGCILYKHFEHKIYITNLVYNKIRSEDGKYIPHVSILLLSIIALSKL